MNDKRLALIMSSYKRPERLYRQLACMLRQTYRHFRIFVTVKGVPQYICDTMFQGAFRDEIEAGLVNIRFDPNKNQLSNYLDAVRGVDPDEFDLFVKIDDDDFYAPHFLENLNQCHQGLPASASSFLWGKSPLFSDGYVMGWFDKFPGGSGCAVCPSIICDLLLYEQVPAEARRRWLEENYPELKLCRRDDRYGMREDNLILNFARMYGYFNRWSSLPRPERKNLFIPKRFGASVIRPDQRYLSSSFRNMNKIVSTDPRRWEYAVCLKRQEGRYEPAFVFDGRIAAADGSWNLPVEFFMYRSKLVLHQGKRCEYIHRGCDVYEPVDHA